MEGGALVAFAPDHHLLAASHPRAVGQPEACNHRPGTNGTHKRRSEARNRTETEQSPVNGATIRSEIWPTLV